MTDDLAGLNLQDYRAELRSMGASPEDADSAVAQLRALQHAGTAPPATAGLGVTIHLRDDEGMDAGCDLAGIVDAVSRGARSGPVIDGAGVEVGVWTLDTNATDNNATDAYASATPTE